MTPELAAIEQHLELDHLTEIVNRVPMNYEAGDGLVQTVARGSVRARRGRNHVRPMFQVMGSGAGSAHTDYPQPPCPSCGDFSRSWNCDTHRELDDGTV